ncbi:MAG: DNA repair protein RecO [Ignavibacteria bacterium]|nr:MAG: DNA repair protein RecO [Ignavibacteria bacterium]KAF0160641.1 MAG: DNA repair protein RecO [Ignavibacteria bacterium]
MSEIVKTRAIVLRRLDFGDTSRIAHFFTEEFGKLSAMVKGAKSPKSKTGLVIDLLNVVELVLYKKETREVQLVSQVDLLKHFPNIRDDFEKFRFASAVIELLATMITESEPHPKLFEGSVKILSLIDSSNESPKILFAKYFFFFLKELGYEFQFERCSVCGRVLSKGEQASYNFEAGMICTDCRADRLTNFNFSEELFELVFCLNQKKCSYTYKEENINSIIVLLEKFLAYNVGEFKGLKSLKI